jgi:hypothetical protein
LAPLIKVEKIKSHAEVIGLVFPVYDFKAPKIIEDFISKLEGLEDKYLFALCTYGISPLKCLDKLQYQPAVKGYMLNAGFAVMMPHNALGNTSFSPEDREKALVEGKIRISEIARVINNRQSKPVETETIISALLLRGLFLR